MATYSPNGPGVAQVLSEGEVTQFFDRGYVVLKAASNAQEVDAYARAVLGLLPRDLTVPEDWQAYAGRFKPYRKRPDGSRDDCIDIPELLPLFCNRRLYEAAAQLLGSPRCPHLRRLRRDHHAQPGRRPTPEPDHPRRCVGTHQYRRFFGHPARVAGGRLPLPHRRPSRRRRGSTSSLAVTVGCWRPPPPAGPAVAISTRIGNASPTRSPWR